MEQVQQRNQYQWQLKANKFHRVFAQNTDGAEILAEWVNMYCINGFSAPDASVVELAKAEGRREFVSAIINEIKRAESTT